MGTSLDSHVRSQPSYPVVLLHLLVPIDPCRARLDRGLRGRDRSAPRPCTQPHSAGQAPIDIVGDPPKPDLLTPLVTLLARPVLFRARVPCRDGLLFLPRVAPLDP